MRGALRQVFGYRAAARIIPADAGSTPGLQGGDGFGQDHPRGCGEHPRVTLVGMTAGGSSPRMRGAPIELGIHFASVRIIPADAGSTDRRITILLQTKDHPRGCGEHGLAWRVLDAQYGSSLRMRGALSILKILRRNRRIIPADAGSTISVPLSIFGKKDHPRGCGEHHGQPDAFDSRAGSSPRMRGALQPRSTAPG